MTLVVNLKHSSYDIYIGRGSIWGNPFIVDEHGTREEVIEKYEAHLLQNPDLLSQLHELEGKRLGCFCAPKSCHGDVLVKYLNLRKIFAF